MKVSCIIYLGGIYFADAVSKWRTILYFYLFIFFVCISCFCIWSCLNNCYGSLHNYVGITVVAKTWLWHCSFDLYLTVCVLYSTFIIIYLNLIFCSEIWWFIIYLCCHVYTIYIYIYIYGIYMVYNHIITIIKFHE